MSYCFGVEPLRLADVQRLRSAGCLFMATNGRWWGNMIDGIVGTVGTGKSLCACLRMMDAARGGRPCYSNLYPRDHAAWQWLDWPSMKEAGEGLFIVDEAQVWFNSRTFKENTSELAAWQQSRKRGADLCWVAQHENRIDTAIRELTTTLWRPRIVGPWLIAMAEDMDTGERRGFRFWWKRRGFGLYHTDQVIGDRQDPPRLARVSAPVCLPTPLYCERPTHVIVDALGVTRLLPYADNLRDAGILLYRDYSGDYYEIDPDDLTVKGKLYDRSGAKFEVQRLVKAAIMERKRFALAAVAPLGAAVAPSPRAPGLVIRGQ